jgi:hypothetical protein
MVKRLRHFGAERSLDAIHSTQNYMFNSFLQQIGNWTFGSQECSIFYPVTWCEPMQYFQYASSYLETKLHVADPR